MAFLEKHMRIGKCTYNGIWSRLNDNFASTIVYVLMLFAVYELWAFVSAGVLYLVTRIPLPAVMFPLLVVVGIAMHAVLLWLVGFIYLWLPCMQITGFRPIEEAIITRGGVNVKEIYPASMKSKLCEGLYFIGEVLDLDAYTGGYNLQIAFSTAIAAARDAIS